MSVGKIMQFATEGLKAVKSMPLAGKVAVAALFGVGTMTGVLIGDSFEKGENKEVKEETELVTQPKEPADTVKVEQEPADTVKVEQEPAFVYNPPEVGISGVASTDTIFYLGTKQPSRIMYYDENDDLRHQTEYGENGELESYSVCFDRDNWDEYNNKGEWTESRRVDKYGISTLRVRDKGLTLTSQYDSEGRPIVKEYAQVDIGSSLTEGKVCYGVRSELYTYNPDGSYSTTVWQPDNCKFTEVFDKNGRLIKKKEYNSDNELIHTITPKYNNEGDIVRRDTIPNK